ncbi:MAG: hypothetical protein K0M69_09125 [Youngiibacter sp.]|nr:hypothetical protein [Youngiibacter sp.]
MWKTLRVNMSELSVAYEDYKYTGFGNRGTVAKTLTDEVNPNCDPLGAQNKLIIACGAMSGSNLSSCGRISFGAKSPLTGGIKEANSGGQLATYLARQGIMSIIVEGQTDNQMKFLVVDQQGNAKFVDAEKYTNMTTYDSIKNITDEYGKNLGIAVIGPAGERKYKIASIHINDYGNNYPCRAAARGGLGAVMGSKGLKGIIVEKAAQNFVPTYINPEIVKEKRNFLNKAAALDAKEFELRKIGTPAGIKHAVQIGKCPLKNFSGEEYEGVENLYPDKYMEYVNKNGGSTGNPCLPGCVVACQGNVNDEQGKHLTAGFEYETLALLGANCGHTDIRTVLKLDRMCDELGIDTIEAGAIIGVIMESGKLSWGDGEGAIEMLDNVAKGNDMGTIFGQGVEAMAAHLGVKRVPVVRHQSIPGYDPRACVPTGMAFAMGTQGADHTVCPSSGNFYGKPIEEVMGVYKNTERAFAVVDNLLCMMNFIFMGKHLPELAMMYAGIYGGDGSVGQLMSIGQETLDLEHAWNAAAGWKKEDNTLPQFFFDEKLPQTDQPFTIPEYVLKS